jgi:hypothetical protein
MVCAVSHLSNKSIPGVGRPVVRATSSKQKMQIIVQCGVWKGKGKQVSFGFPL